MVSATPKTLPVSHVTIDEPIETDLPDESEIGEVQALTEFEEDNQWPFKSHITITPEYALLRFNLINPAEGIPPMDSDHEYLVDLVQEYLTLSVAAVIEKAQISDGARIHIIFLTSDLVKIKEWNVWCEMLISAAFAFRKSIESIAHFDPVEGSMNIHPFIEHTHQLAHNIQGSKVSSPMPEVIEITRTLSASALWRDFAKGIQF